MDQRAFFWTYAVAPIIIREYLALGKECVFTVQQFDDRHREVQKVLHRESATRT